MPSIALTCLLRITCACLARFMQHQTRSARKHLPTTNACTAQRRFMPSRRQQRAQPPATCLLAATAAFWRRQLSAAYLPVATPRCTLNGTTLAHWNGDMANAVKPTPVLTDGVRQAHVTTRLVPWHDATLPYFPMDVPCLAGVCRCYHARHHRLARSIELFFNC